jgi:hypothetical protein
MIGRIYRIIDSQSDLCYIGSTGSSLKLRWKRHKDHYQKWVKGKSSEITIYPYFKQYGITRFKIVLIKEYNVFDKKHLEAYEQLWINKLCCVNKRNPICIKRMYHSDYRCKNREKVNEYHKRYDIEHKRRKAVWRHAKFDCECGGKYTRGDKSRRFNTKKHKSYIGC